MNTTTKASMGATVLLLVVALVFAVQNMAELRSARQAVKDRDLELGRLARQLQDEKDTNRELIAQLQRPAAGTATPSAAVLERLNALEAEVRKKDQEFAAQEREKQLLADRVQQRAVPEAELTAMQKRIRDAVSIAKVQNVHTDAGFVVIDAGSAQGLEPGFQCAIRRDLFIVGRGQVSSVEGGKVSIVDIIPESLQLGQNIEPGDSVIAYPF